MGIESTKWWNSLLRFSPFRGNSFVQQTAALRDVGSVTTVLQHTCELYKCSFTLWLFDALIVLFVDFFSISLHSAWVFFIFISFLASLYRCWRRLYLLRNVVNAIRMSDLSFEPRNRLQCIELPMAQPNNHHQTVESLITSSCLANGLSPLATTLAVQPKVMIMRPRLTARSILHQRVLLTTTTHDIKTVVLTGFP